MDIYDFAKDLLAKNPDKANTPLGKQLSQILESKDYSAGEQLGQNICKTYNVKPEDAIAQGKRFFGF